MEENKINLLLSEYHKFCIELIKKIPPESLSDDRLVQKAFKFRDEIEKVFLEVQIKYKQNGKNYYTEEIEDLKKIISSQKAADNV